LRGQDNSPENIPLIVKKIAEVKKIDYNFVVKNTTFNAFRLFDF